MRVFWLVLAVVVLVSPAVVCCLMGGRMLLLGLPSLLLWLGLGCLAAAGLYDDYYCSNNNDCGDDYV